MNPKQVIVVGEPTFRQRVAMAMGLPAETISWVANAAAAEKSIVDAGGEMQLLAIAPQVQESEALQIAEFANRASPATAVVLVRSTTPNGSLTRFVRAGIRDVVDLSSATDELESSLRRALEWAKNIHDRQGYGEALSKENLGRIVTVFSSKGGAGKTFLACNLAAAIADRTGRDTALVDLDFGSGDVFSYYGRDPKRPLEDLFAPGGLDDRETILQAGTELAPHLWAFGAPPDPSVEPIPSQGVGMILRSLQMHFDFVLVDGSAQYTDQMLAAFDASDAICLIASLDVVGVRHLVKSLETLTSIGVSKESICTVLNRADSKVGLDTADVEKVTGILVDAQIPSSRLVPTSLNKGIPVYLDEPRSPVAQSIGALTDRLVSELVGEANGSARERRTKRRLFSRGS